MNPRADIWNVLHDGEIAALSGQLAGDVFITVDIPYLRHMFSQTGESIILTLKECHRFDMKIWDQKDDVTSDFNRIVATRTEILSTESDDTPIHIITTNGEIDADFKSFSLSLDDGTPITFEELCDACKRYWNEWEENAKNKR